MELIGSTTSPYVRRLRILLKDTPYDFKSLSIYEGKDREFLKTLSPVLKIPILKDEGQILFDSRVIFNYLISKDLHPKLSPVEENNLTVIDAINDTLIQFFLLKKSGVNPDGDEMYFRINRERVLDCWKYLEGEVKKGSFKEWRYPAISLFCLLDWVQFRNTWNMECYPKLSEFLEDLRNGPYTKETDPR